MFVDRVQMKLIAGKGGNGIVAWRREKFLAKGGPYGGNGGRGGDVILEADNNIYSLEAYRHRHLMRAENGREGGTNLKQGRSGKDLIIKVPYGTLVKDKETGEVLFDFTYDGPSKWTLCEGGRGGKGNNCFKTSTRQAPNFCTPGTAGKEGEFELELKLIADVGLVGLPNAGKSTLLSKITHANAKIGAYPFTTLTPNLSFIQLEDYRRVLIADIPGIIKDAHQNKGLGLAFLRHIERTSALIFVIDLASEEEDRTPLEDFSILRNELVAYDPSMGERPFLVALNKMDHPDAEANLKEFSQKSGLSPDQLFPISALEGEGLDRLVGAIGNVSLPDPVSCKN